MNCTAPSIEAARAMGETGSPPVEAERLAFEAWMQGHCWVVGGEWDGASYRHPNEIGTYIDAQAMLTRQLWAAWRDRAALCDLISTTEQERLSRETGFLWGARTAIGADATRSNRTKTVPMPAKRYRRRHAKPGQLIAYYGTLPGNNPDICYAWGGAGACKQDGNFLADVFGGKRLHLVYGDELKTNGGFPAAFDPCFLEELEVRGYDLTTLRFSIQKKAAPDDSL